LTRLSAVVAAGSADANERARAFETLVTAYWMPLYKYVRIKWNKTTEDAQDLTQGFFAEALEKNFFARYDPAKAKFRTFVRTCLDGFVANDEKASKRKKRGGDQIIVSLDFEEAEHQLQVAQPPALSALDDYFEKEWARSVFTLSLDALRKQLETSGKSVHLKLFERYVLDETEERSTAGYKELAKEFGIKTTDVTNYLAYARREFRRIILEKLRELTANDEEFRREARALLGIDAN
jgi:DNA-directed RNA polymerase specialized sigma24 family protein